MYSSIFFTLYASSHYATGYICLLSRNHVSLSLDRITAGIFFIVTRMIAKRSHRYQFYITIALNKGKT